MLQLNLEISRREEEINALSEQLTELDKSQLTGELDLLAEQENTLVKLLALAKQSNDKIQVGTLGESKRLACTNTEHGPGYDQHLCLLP